jgi:hypothetical protein
VTKRISRRDARAKVQALEAFQTNNGNLFARWETPDTYVVYSYGQHWPLFIWDKKLNLWVENGDKRSPTTSQHRGYTHPHAPTQKHPVVALITFINHRVGDHIKHLEATQLPLWYVRWTDYNCRKPIDLIQLAFDDHPEQWGRGYAYVRAVDEMGAYAAAVARKRKKAI